MGTLTALELVTNTGVTHARTKAIAANKSTVRSRFMSLFRGDSPRDCYIVFALKILASLLQFVDKEAKSRLRLSATAISRTLTRKLGPVCLWAKLLNMRVIYLFCGHEHRRADKRHRPTLTKKVRNRFKIIAGQKFFIVPYGDDLLLKPVPQDPAARLSELIGDLKLTRDVKIAAEKWSIEETKRRKHGK